MDKTIAVTGANGFIGSALVQHLNAAGYKVIALVHRMPENKVDGVEYHNYDLKDEPDATIFNHVDTLIHLAFNFARPEGGEADINIKAAEYLLRLNLSNYILVSSFSATEDATAYYGECKYKLEAVFAGYIIIRPGLVVGDGGLFSRLRTQIKSNAFVPLIAGGKQPVQLIAVTDLVKILEKALVTKMAGVFNVAHPRAITYKQMIVLASGNKKIIFIPVPTLIIRGMIRVLRFLGKRDISEDNLDGLINSHIVDTSPDLLKLQINLNATEELMRNV